MAPRSDILIERLNDAERQAESIIEDAKKYRKALMAKAREAAEEELKGFSAGQEYSAALEITKDDDATQELAAATSNELAMVESDFNKNKDRTVGYVVDKVLDVPLALTSTQAEALRAEAGRPPVQAKAGAPKRTQPASAPAKPAPAPAPEPVKAAPPVVEEPPAPAPPPEEEPAEAEEETPAAQEEPATAEEEAAPAVEEATPAVEESTPAVEETAAAVDVPEEPTQQPSPREEPSAEASGGDKKQRKPRNRGGKNKQGGGEGGW